MKTEYILQAAGDAFRAQFESELRQRLLDVATAEIEHIVREVSRGVTHQVGAEFNRLECTYSLNHKVEYHARSPKKPVHC